MNLSRLLFLSLFICFVVSNQDDDDDNLSDFDDHPDSEVEDNVFKKRKEYKHGAQFSCNECQKLGHNAYAQATKSGNFTSDGIEKYILKALPHHHECSPSSINGLIKKFSDCLYSAVKNDPTKPIPRIYEECREQISDGLCDDEKLLLFREIPNFRNIQSGLYKHRIIIICKSLLQNEHLYFFIPLSRA